MVSTLTHSSSAKGRLRQVGPSPNCSSSSEGHVTGLCAHCLLCLCWSLFIFTFMHIKYTGVCVPGLALTHLCFFCFEALS